MMLVTALLSESFQTHKGLMINTGSCDKRAGEVGR